MAIDKDFYNEASGLKLGWDPSWFGCTAFDDILIKAVKKWQSSHNIKPDGLVGPTTFRRVWTDREANISSHKPSTNSGFVNAGNACEDNHIVHNGQFYPIKWDKVVLWDQPNGLKCIKGNYNDYTGKPSRNVKYFVNHWDVCLSAKSMSRVINKRGISIHFGIDNDGTIYQMLDTQHAAWQAGGRKWNHESIGVEVSNAYYMKYQNWYVKNGHGKRPIDKNLWVHGNKLRDHLGFYPVQIKALQALWEAINTATGIPLECPTDSSGKLVNTVDKRCASGNFNGFINHFNLTKRKIDCAGLDLIRLLDEIKNW